MALESSRDIFADFALHHDLNLHLVNWFTTFHASYFYDIPKCFCMTNTKIKKIKEPESQLSDTMGLLVKMIYIIYIMLKAKVKNEQRFKHVVLELTD